MVNAAKTLLLTGENAPERKISRKRTSSKPPIPKIQKIVDIYLGERASCACLVHELGRGAGTRTIPSMSKGVRRCSYLSKKAFSSPWCALCYIHGSAASIEAAAQCHKTLVSRFLPKPYGLSKRSRYATPACLSAAFHNSRRHCRLVLHQGTPRHRDCVVRIKHVFITPPALLLEGRSLRQRAS